MSTKNSLVIVIGSAKQSGAQICNMPLKASNIMCKTEK